MSISGFPGEDVDTHLKIYGHLPEIECYKTDEPPIVCRNPKYKGVLRRENTPTPPNKPTPHAGKRAWKTYRRQMDKLKQYGEKK